MIFFTVLAIAPMLILGLWLMFSESFASLVSARRFRHLEFKETRRARARLLAASERSHLADLFLVLAVASLFGCMILALSWQIARGPLLFGLLFSGVLLAAHMQQTKRKYKRTLEDVDRELPQFIQALCLLVSSGVTPVKALDLISRRSSTPLGRALGGCVSEISEGKSISEALDRLTARLATPGIRRFVTTLFVATERGAPLVPVLVALIRDTQVEQRARMLRQAGRTEIALMIPVVFLLLPISVLFALFPSILQLQIFAR